MIDPRLVPVRFSHLKMFARSPSHYLHAAQGTDDNDNLARRIGTGAHALLLGTPLVVFEGVRNGAWWEAFKEEHAGQTIVSEGEYDESNRIADAVLRNKTACDLLFPPDAVLEEQINWFFLGRKCSSRPDSRSMSSGIVVDLKKTRSAEPNAFLRQGTWLHYHVQGAFYQEAIRSAQLGPCDKVFIVAVEGSPPYPVTVFEIDEETLDLGRRMYRGWFEELLNCERTGTYPAYSEWIVPFRVEPAVELTMDGELFDVAGAEP